VSVIVILGPMLLAAGAVVPSSIRELRTEVEPEAVTSTSD
jgi:hypothetical protein